jgi:hypothetical protein
MSGRCCGATKLGLHGTDQGAVLVDHGLQGLGADSAHEIQKQKYCHIITAAISGGGSPWGRVRPLVVAEGDSETVPPSPNAPRAGTSSAAP